MKKIILAVRHGIYNGSGEMASPLLDEGKDDISAVSVRFNDYLTNVFGRMKTPVKIGVALSNNLRVIQTLSYLCDYDSFQVIWPGPLLADRDDIKEDDTNEIYDLINELYLDFQAVVAVVVCHGDMSAVLTEYIVTQEFPDKNFVIPNRFVSEGTGFIINLESQEVFNVNKSDITLLNTKNAEVDLTIEMEGNSLKKVCGPIVGSSSADVEIITGKNVEDDDDIPF